MLRTDEGRRFTDDAYATKKEVQAVYNLDDVSHIWEKVLTYRSFYDAETDLIDSESNHYKVCLTKQLLSKSYHLLNAYLLDLLSFSSLSLRNQRLFLTEKKAFGIKALARYLNTNLPDTMATKLAKGEVENSSASLFALRAYCDAYEYAFSVQNISLKEMENINLLVSGESLEGIVKYRDDIQDILNPLTAPKKEEIQKHLQALQVFLLDETIPVVLRAISILYVFHYLRPFDSFNEVTAALYAKAFLKTHGLGVIGFSLDFESIAFTHSESFFAKEKTTETSLDLTYFLFYILPYFLTVENDDQNRLREYIRKTSEENEEQENTNPSAPKMVSIKDDLTYALPNFPTESKSEDVEATAAKLLEVHPHLKKKQAHFYAGHCTIGLHYSIEQFKESEHSVYETARTSMEDLAKRGFYKKEQIGKKFVYTPIPLKDE